MKPPFDRADPARELWETLTSEQQAKFVASMNALGVRQERPQFYATGPGVPDSTNVFVPSTGSLVVGYSRNIRMFKLPRYVEYRPSQHTVGLYPKLSPRQSVRVPNTKDFLWPDHQPRPRGEKNLASFNLVEYRTTRYDYPWQLGWRTANQATIYNVRQAQKGVIASQCMTARTIRFLSTATTVANWQTTADSDLGVNHTDTAVNVGGGQLDQGTSTAPYIKKALNKIAITILKDTVGVVTPEMLKVVMSPTQAHLWAESSEIHEYVKSSPAAQNEIQSGMGPNVRYGLPSTVYGYQVEIEDCVKDTVQKGETESTSFAFPDQTVLVTSRVGGIEGVEGAPAFSTLILMAYEEMSQEERDEQYDRLTRGNVTEDVAEVLATPLSGYLLTSTTASAG